LYSSSSAWPLAANGLGATLELSDPISDNNIGSNWHAGLSGGTTGRKNGTYNLNENLRVLHESPNCFPTRFSDFTTLKFSSKAREKYRIDIIDLSGRIRETHSGTGISDETLYFDLFKDNNSNFERGVYFIKVKAGQTTNTLRVVKT
jgi:hypothetical protein